jgi:hypothetical protein
LVRCLPPAALDYNVPDERKQAISFAFPPPHAAEMRCMTDFVDCARSRSAMTDRK